MMILKINDLFFYLISVIFISLTFVRRHMSWLHTISKVKFFINLKIKSSRNLNQFSNNFSISYQKMFLKGLTVKIIEF